MAPFLLVVFMLMVRCSQALLLATPQATVMAWHGPDADVNAPQPTAPSSPDLVKRMLMKRTLTQTCGYFGATFSFVCDTSSYCGYGDAGDFGCWPWNSTASTFENYQLVTECFNAARFSSECASTSQCNAGTAWCNNPESSQTECSTYILTGDTTHSAFACGATATAFFGAISPSASDTTSSNETTEATSSSSSRSTRSNQPSATTATRSVTVTATPITASTTSQSGSGRSVNVVVGTVILCAITAVVLDKIVLMVF